MEDKEYNLRKELDQIKDELNKSKINSILDDVS